MGKLFPHSLLRALLIDIEPESMEAIKKSFIKLYPDTMAQLPNLRIIEHHSYADLKTVAPYSYVADTVHEIKLSADVDELRGEGLRHDTWAAIALLRDSLHTQSPEATRPKLGWYVVYCEDPERSIEPQAKAADGQPKTEGKEEPVVAKEPDEEKEPVEETTAPGLPERSRSRRASIGAGLKRAFTMSLRKSTR